MLYILPKFCKQQLTDEMSQYGQCFGYLGSLTLCIVALAILIVLTDTQYVQYDGYGVTSGDDIESHAELWLKKVVDALCYLCFIPYLI